MLKYIFPTSKDNLPTAILMDTALTLGLLLGNNMFGGIMADHCPANYDAAITNPMPVDKLALDFCSANNELSIASPIRTAANLKFEWYLLKRKVGLEPQ